MSMHFVVLRIGSSEITAEPAYRKRRDFIRAAGLAAVQLYCLYSSGLGGGTGGAPLYYARLATEALSIASAANCRFRRGFL